jgi:molybdopterin converting factor small subunit
MAKIIIPTPLRKFTENNASFITNATTIGTAIQDLAKTYQPLATHLYDNKQELRSFLRIYLGDNDINVLDKSDTVVSQDDIISIVPAIAGGSSLKKARL